MIKVFWELIGTKIKCAPRIFPSSANFGPDHFGPKIGISAVFWSFWDHFWPRQVVTCDTQHQLLLVTTSETKKFVPIKMPKIGQVKF